jgi:hypothetical protein
MAPSHWPAIDRQPDLLLALKWGGSGVRSMGGGEEVPITSRGELVVGRGVSWGRSRLAGGILGEDLCTQSVRGKASKLPSMKQMALASLEPLSN